MKATKYNYKDVSKYFLNTTILVPEVDPKRVFYLDYVGPDVMRMVDFEGNKGCIELGEFDYTIQSPLVTRRQWYQSGNNAAFITRIPARMWRKGISEENTYISYLTTTGWGNFPVKLATLQTFVENKDVFPNKLEAKDDLVSVALSPSWAVVLKSQTLFLFNVPVGKVNMDKQLVLLLKEFAKVKLPEALVKWSVSYV